MNILKNYKFNYSFVGYNGYQDDSALLNSQIEINNDKLLSECFFFDEDEKEMFEDELFNSIFDDEYYSHGGSRFYEYKVEFESIILTSSCYINVEYKDHNDLTQTISKYIYLEFDKDDLSKYLNFKINDILSIIENDSNLQDLILSKNGIYTTSILSFNIKYDD